MNPAIMTKSQYDLFLKDNSFDELFGKVLNKEAQIVGSVSQIGELCSFVPEGLQHTSCKGYVVDNTDIFELTLIPYKTGYLVQESFNVTGRRTYRKTYIVGSEVFFNKGDAVNKLYQKTERAIKRLQNRLEALDKLT